MKYLVVFPFLYLALHAVRFEKALTQDLGRHIVMGREIAECVCVPAVNLFSYTQPEQMFVNHHWFSEVLFFLLYSSGGMLPLFLFKVLLLAVSFWLVFHISFKISRFWTLVFSFPFIYVFSYRFDIRPELISFLCLGVFLTVVYRFREKRDYRILFLLLPVQILWVNSHIYFFIGLMLYAFFVIEQYVLSPGFSRNKHVLVIGVLLLASVFVNPNHLYGALYPLTIFESYGYSIYENQGILFLNSRVSDVRVLVFEILAFLLVSGLFVLRKKNLFVLLSGVFAVVVPFIMIRNLPLFVFIAFPALALVCQKIEGKIRQKHNTLFIRRSVLFLIFVVFAVHTFQIVRKPEFSYSLHYIDAGRGAADFYKGANLEGPIFNNFDIGSYLIFQLFPNERVFVDGRPEAYSVDFFSEYKEMQEKREFFDKKASEYGFEAIIFSATDITPWAQSFYSFIFNHPEWVLVYRDQWYVVLVRKGSENEQRAVDFIKDFSSYEEDYFIRRLDG